MPARVSTSTPYDAYERVLRAAHGMTDPAEAHGILVGALCASDDYQCAEWLAEILPEGPVPAETRAALHTLYAETRAALGSPDLGLQLLCQGDDAEIDDRTQALSLWCNGFVYGLGVQGGADPRQLPGDVGEIVRDLGEIAHAGVDAGDGDEANEGAYAELVEFVRVGVQLIHEELRELRAPPTPRPPASASLH